MFYITEALYTSEKEGNDETGDGSEQKPYKTILQVGKVTGCIVSDIFKYVM